jgi:hypothetical protein
MVDSCDFVAFGECEEKKGDFSQTSQITNTMFQSKVLPKVMKYY